jgi:RNA polymerase sigma factor (TIGR02999 family)
MRSEPNKPKKHVEHAETNHITMLLHEYRDGNNEAMDKLMGLVYEQLKVMAHRYTVKERTDNTLNTTGLVHDAYLKISGQNNRSYENRSHFYAIVSTCMRRAIMEVVRNKNAHKRGNGAQKVALEDHFLISDGDAEQILHINNALEKLAEFDQRLADITEYRYFGGMKMEEIAEAMDCSLSTVKRDWRLAKAWLQAELSIG